MRTGLVAQKGMLRLIESFFFRIDDFKLSHEHAGTGTVRRAFVARRGVSLKIGYDPYHGRVAHENGTGLGPGRNGLEIDSERRLGIPKTPRVVGRGTSASRPNKPLKILRGSF